MPPTVMFGGEATWSPRAVLLAETLHIYEASLCQGCSLHAQIGFDPLNTGHVTVDDSVSCLGCEALEHYRDQHKDLYPGTKLFVTTDLGGDDVG